MAEINHYYSDGVEVNHFSDAAVSAAVSGLQAAAFPAQADGTPDADTKISDLVGAASTIAAAFVARNYEKHGDRGQYSLDTIARMSVSLAEKIHADVHATVHGTD